jgi:hypothetical protein
MVRVDFKYFPCCAVLFLAASSWAFDAPRVERLPKGGIQPQAVADSGGGLHVVYLAGDPAASDVYYIRRIPDHESFSEPLRVNSEAGSAVAVGAIRGAHLALGVGDRVHVVWNGSRAGENGAGPPMLYARLNDAGDAFEAQRNLMTSTKELDGGGSVAADAEGNVYAVWHAAESSLNEADRAVYLARSTDGGKTFAPERRVNPGPTGACGCCSLKAFVDSRGILYIAYRAAGQAVHRDATLLASKNRGETFAAAVLHPWLINACPMSSFAFAEAGSRVTVAWETQSQIYFASIDPQSLEISNPRAIPGPPGRKHPVLAGRASGDVLVAWARGTAWQRGGDLEWLVLDSAGNPSSIETVADGIPVWGLPAAASSAGSGFTLIH